MPCARWTFLRARTGAMGAPNWRQLGGVGGTRGWQVLIGAWDGRKRATACRGALGAVGAACPRVLATAVSLSGALRPVTSSRSLRRPSERATCNCLALVAVRYAPAHVRGASEQNMVPRVLLFADAEAFLFFFQCAPARAAALWEGPVRWKCRGRWRTCSTRPRKTSSLPLNKHPFDIHSTFPYLPSDQRGPVWTIGPPSVAPFRFAWLPFPVSRRTGTETASSLLRPSRMSDHNGNERKWVWHVPLYRMHLSLHRTTCAHEMRLCRHIAECVDCTNYR